MNRPAPHGGTPAWRAHPILSLLIAAAWLLLQGSLAPAHLLWAATLGIGLPWLTHTFLGPAPRLRRAGLALRLAAVVLWDIVVANLVVARLVLDPTRQPRPAWVRVRATVSDPRGLALLATIITNTPGTVSALVDEAAGEILVHILDTDDPQAVADDILRRYDAPLQEIFG
jgi:multicomponent K+:H+ antiporter subunit E